MATLPLWLADYQLLAAALLLGVMLALAALRQPAQRLAVAKSTLAALATLALLCALPGWSLVHLLSDDATIAEPAATRAAPTPAFSATLSTIEPTPDLFNAQPPESPTGGVLQASPRNEVEPASPISWSTYLVAAYATGTAAVTLWLITGALLARRVRQQATPAPLELQELLQQVCGQEKPVPQLLISDRIAAPVALGIYRPAILLPYTFDQSSRSDFVAPSPWRGGLGRGANPAAATLLEGANTIPPASPHQVEGIKQDISVTLLPILAHELAHLQHRDLHTLAATRLLLILLWPQPLYWLLRRTIRLDQETLADAAAADRAGRLDYAQQLLAWASSASTQRPPRLAGAVGLWEGPSQLKRRIAVLLNEQFEVMRTCSRRWRLLSVSCVGAVVATLSLVTLQPVTDAAEEDAAASTATPPDVVMARKNELLRGIVREKNSVRGYCIDEHGKPLAGAKISLFDYRSSGYDRRPHVFRETLSDQRGYFSIDAAIDVEQAKLDGIPVDKPFDSTNGWIPITINAHAPGRAASYDHIPTVLLVQDGDLRMFELRPGKSLNGKVTDAAGRPVAGVQVTAGGYVLSSATTDASGDYEIRDLYPMDGTPGHQLTPVEFRHPDFALQKAGPATVPGKLDVTLQPGGDIEGRVEIQDGEGKRPAANVDVMIARITPYMPGENLPNVPGMQYSRTIDRELVRTNDAGEYRIQSLAPGDYGVTVIQNELVTNGVAPVAVKAKEKVTAPPIVLTRGVRIRVELIDAETKQPIPFDKQAQGVLNPVLGSPTIPSMQMRREFKPYVDFGEVNVAPGKYSLLVAIPNERLISINDRRPTGDFPPYHEFRVEEGKDLVFVVPMKKDSDAWVVPDGLTTLGTSNEGLGTISAAEIVPTVDAPAGGKPTVDDLAVKPPATETRHRSIGQAGIFTAVGGPPKVPVYRPNAFTVRAVDADAKPLSGVEVLLYRTSFTDGLQQQIATTTTNDDGEATFNELVPAEQIKEDRESEAKNRMGNNHRPVFLAALRGPGFATATVSKSSIDIGQRGVERTVIMRPSAALTGRVTDPQGNPVANATVAAGGMASWLAIPGVNAVTTNDDGEFRFDDRVVFARTKPERSDSATHDGAALKINAYEMESDEAPLDPAKDQEAASLIVTHPDFAMTTAVGDRIPGEVNVQLRSAASIRGRILDYKSGAPVAGIPIHALGMPALDPNKPVDPSKTASHSARTTTDANGEYELRNLPAGRYDVWAEPATAPFENRPWTSRGVSAIPAIPGNASATAPDLIVGPPPKLRVQLVNAETGAPIQLTAGASAQPFENLVGGPQFQNVGVHRVEVTTDGVFEVEATPGKLRLGAFVYDGEQKYPPAFQTDDSVYAAGEVLDLRLGETQEATLKVYPGELLVKLREREQSGHKLMAEKKYAEAADAFGNILRDHPANRDALIGRGYAYRSAGDFGRAIADFEAALASSGDDQQAELMLADLLATSPVEGTRNGKRALRFAQRALADERNRHQYDTSGLVMILEVVAAAYAETADFENAMVAQREAIEVAPESRKADLKKRLELYQSNNPFRRETAFPSKQEAVKKPANQGASTESNPRAPFWAVPTSTDFKLTITGAPPDEAERHAIDARAPESETWRLLPESALKVSNPTTLQEAVK